MPVNVYEILNKIKKFKLSMVIAAFAASFFIVSAGNVVLIDTSFDVIEFTEKVSIPISIGAIVLIMLALLILSYIYKLERLIPLALVVSTGIMLTAMSLEYRDSIWFYAGCMLLLLIVMLFYVKNTDSYENDRLFNHRNNLIVAAVLFLFFTVMTSIVTIYRYKVFGSSCFDFGIFAQMFEYMRTTGLPDTTIERNKLLSHFAVHFSPFFYFLLPGYCITPTAEYLLVSQSFCVGLGVLAIPGICRELGVKAKHTLMFIVMYIFYPTLSYGLIYDFHENKFLTVCIIWTFYFMLKKKYIPMYILALMTCMVKEDAAIYIVAISLFMLFEMKNIKNGVIMLFGALVYFVFALKMVQVCGGGESDFGYRFDDFNTGDGVTVGTIIKTMLLDFGYALKVMFTNEKFEFLLWMMIPVAFMPFFTRKIATLFLLTPMLFVNFLSSWTYQYDIYYQYTFGAAAIIIFSSIYVSRKMNKQTIRTLIGIAAIICVVITVPKYVSTYKYYSETYRNDEILYKETDEVLARVPQDASVTADGYLIPHMHDHKDMYLNSYDEKTDYLIIDLLESSSFKTFEDNKDDYTVVDGGGRCLVLKRNDLIEE